MKIEDFKYKKVAILWFWKEWKSTLSFLTKAKVSDITILDFSTNIQKKEGINYVLWNKYLDDLDLFDIIFIAPWISPYNEKIFPYKHKLTSNFQVFFDNYDWKIIWISWTKWKSTTSSILFETLKKAWFKALFWWNIWKPILDEIDIFSNERYDYILLELSSYTLENLDFSLDFWLVINIYEEHLDWHNWFENYRKAKINLLKSAKTAISLSDIWFNTWIKIWKNLDYFFDWKTFFKDWESVYNVDEILIEWQHFYDNIAFIFAFCDINNIDFSYLWNVLKNFSWLEHRMEKVWIFDWITFINDANSATPDSTIKALETYKNDVWTLFLWWLDRWYNFSFLSEKINSLSIENIVLFPDTWKKIKPLLDKNIKIFETSDMKKAVEIAFKYTKKDKICLLSMASPSYNLWKNFEEKWNLYKKFIFDFTKMKK